MATHNEQSVKSSSNIVRIWRGWTTPENAIKLERALREEAIPGIEANKPKGLNGIEFKLALTEAMLSELQTIYRVKIAKLELDKALGLLQF